jgi:hypothetical protein
MYHVVATKNDGTLWAWGNNNFGQLGINSISNYSSPKQVGALTNWLNIAGGQYHVVATKTDGTLWAWGTGTYGVLGLGTQTNYSSPKQVGAMTNWSKPSAYTYASAAVKTDGTLWAWGDNRAGELGLGNITAYSSPKQVGALTDWSVVYRGNSTTFAIKTDGTLWSWGSNTQGQLGLGNTTAYSSPKQVGALTNWGSIATPGEFILALTKPPATVPDKPTNVQATAGDSSATVTFTAPANGGSAITGYTVSVYTGGTKVGTVSGVSTSINVTGLVNGTTYTFTVKATNAIGTGLESEGNAPSVGSATQGGYYAGKVVDGGVTYALIVAPKASGANGGATLTWGAYGSSAPVATQTLTNGVAASNAMNSSEYPAAFYCKGLNIGGFTDWYLPARDELEVLYRNLKPGTTANYVAANWRTGTGFGTDGGANGYNANSSPVGAAYTSGSPAQSGIAAFKTGGTEVFVENYYWSSTEFGTNSAWLQSFSNGYQSFSTKNNGNYVQAIRRVLPSVISPLPSATPVALTIGGAYAGGYYAGNIVDGGVTYKLIVAPKASGANGGAKIQWKTSNTAAPVATQTLTNGVAASNAMNSSSYPAAFYCKGLNIAGYTDWYLPARDELEVLYRNLKPGTSTNVVGNRPNNGFGGDGLGYGTNANSSPVGAAYTSGSPGQTGIAVFKTGGTESFVEDWYWSSTESDTSQAWNQYFQVGYQSLVGKDGSSFTTRYVRAIRRVL